MVSRSSLKQILECLTLGKYVHPSDELKLTFAQNGLKLREKLLTNLHNSLTPKFQFRDRVKSTQDILDVTLASGQRVGNIVQHYSTPVTFLQPFPEQCPDAVQFSNSDDVSQCFETFTIFQRNDQSWNFLYQDFMRSRRQWWKRNFFNPGQNLQVIESSSKGPTPNASIEAVLDSTIASNLSKLNLETIRICDSQDLNSNSVGIIESRLFLNNAAAAILLTSVRKRIFLNSARLALPKDLSPYQVAIGAASSDVKDFVRYLHLLLEEQQIQVWKSDKDLSQEKLLESSDHFGIPYVIIVPQTVLENGVLMVRDRESTCSEQIHAANVTQRLVKIFQGRDIKDTWSQIAESHLIKQKEPKIVKKRMTQSKRKSPKNTI